MRGYSRTPRHQRSLRYELEQELARYDTRNFAGQSLDQVGTFLKDWRGAGLNYAKVRQDNLNKLQGELDCRKWKALGLMPVVDIPEVNELAQEWSTEEAPPLLLTWKHVRPGRETTTEMYTEAFYDLPHWRGNLDAPYQIMRPYLRPSMCTAAPAGAIKDWSFGFSRLPGGLQTPPPVYVMSIAGVTSSQDDERGVYFALFGIPLSVYEVRKCAGEELDMRLVDGMDTLSLIL